jgi:gamma-glutamyl phosphate reductase
MTVEPITVWVALGCFVVGMIVGALVVYSEWQRARLRWLEAMQTRQDEIKAVAEELRREHNKLPQHNAPDMVAAIREGVTEQLKKRSA